MYQRLTWESLPDHYNLARPGDMEYALGNLLLPRPRGFVVRGSVPEDADEAYATILQYMDEHRVEWFAMAEEGYDFGHNKDAGTWHTDCRATATDAPPDVAALRRHSFHRTRRGEVTASFAYTKPALWSTVPHHQHQLPDDARARLKQGLVDPDHFYADGHRVTLGVGDLCVFPLGGPFPPAHDFTNVVKPRTSNVVDMIIETTQLRATLDSI